MNHGSSCDSGVRLRRTWPCPAPAFAFVDEVSKASARITGPSISTRTSFTNVPTCTLSKPADAVAASTCGTAYTVSPANTPYCVAEKFHNGISSGKPSTAATPSTAVNAIALATSLLSASITGATAAIAELPQIELPHAIRSAIRCGRRSARPMP